MPCYAMGSQVAISPEVYIHGSCATLIWFVRNQYHPYSVGLLHWHKGLSTNAPIQDKQPPKVGARLTKLSIIYTYRQCFVALCCLEIDADILVRITYFIGYTGHFSRCMPKLEVRCYMTVATLMNHTLSNCGSLCAPMYVVAIVCLGCVFPLFFFQNWFAFHTNFQGNWYKYVILREVTNKQLL